MANESGPIKKISVYNEITSSYDTVDIGAKGQYIDIGLDSNGDPVEDPTTETPASTAPLSSVLYDINQKAESGASIVDVNALPQSPVNTIYRTPGGVEESDFAEGYIIYEEGKTASEYISEMSANGFGEYNSTTNSFENFDMILKVKSNNVYKIGTKVKLSINNNIITSFTIEIPTTTPWDPIEYLYVFFDSVDPMFSYKFAPLYNYYAGNETTGEYSRIVDIDLFNKINDTAVYSGDEEETEEILAESTFDAVCKTASAIAAKVASSENYILRTGNRFSLAITNANSAQSALTLNVNETGAKTIYINGAASSSTNYTLPAGTYEVVYDGTNYQIRTDGEIPTVTGSTKANLEDLNAYETKHKLIKTMLTTKPSLKSWVQKTWSGLTNFNGGYTWTDGDDIYYSSGNTSSQYVLDKATFTWKGKTWSGLTNFKGNCIWTDGDNIYYSKASEQYVLNKETSTWSTKTWYGISDFSEFSGNYIWTDGENIYFSFETTHYILDKNTSTWNTKTWSGLTNFKGNYIWADGNNIYYSNGGTNYVLDKNTSTWSTKTWSGLTQIMGSHIWTDGSNIYYSYGPYQYILNREDSIWSAKTWLGYSNPDGSTIWTDGDNIYISNNLDQYMLTSKYIDNDMVSANDINNIESQISTIDSDLASKQIKKTKLSSVAFNNGAGMAYFDWTNKILVSAYEDSGSNAITVTPYNRGNTTTVGFGALVYGLSAFTGTTDIILCYQDIA